MAKPNPSLTNSNAILVDGTKEGRTFEGVGQSSNMTGQMQRLSLSVGSFGKTPFGRGIWHQLGLEFKGDSIDVVIDEIRVAMVKDETFKAGMVGLGCGWHEAQFDSLVVQ
jgi:hypothetical protein